MQPTPPSRVVQYTSNFAENANTGTIKIRLANGQEIMLNINTIQEQTLALLMLSKDPVYYDPAKFGLELGWINVGH